VLYKNPTKTLRIEGLITLTIVPQMGLVLKPHPSSSPSSSYSKLYVYFLVAVSDGSVVGDGAPGIVGRGLSIPLLGSDCPLIAPSPGVVGRDPGLPLSTCPGLCVPGLSFPVLGRSGSAPMFPVPVPVFPGPAGPVPVCPLGPVPEICASTRGAAAKSTARAPTRDLPSLRNIYIFSWSNTGYASLLTSTLVRARLCRAPRADFIRVYGMQPRHWMPAYASMTIKRSFPQKRESRSRTYNCTPL